MPTQEQEIVNYMQEFFPGKWVSPHAAVWKCTTPGCFTALNNLIEEGIVEKKYIDGLPFVRYIKPYTRKLKAVK